MEVVTNNYMPGDPRLVDQIVYELKSQGIFDKFRKECLSDVDTKPAYQNLKQRVEGTVSSFLRQQKWKPDMNKNQVREMLRKNIYESGFLETGVERIVDQVVNPKINTMFLPQVEEVVYKFFGIEKPNKNNDDVEQIKVEPSTEDLLPEDLEAVSPESVQTEKKEEVDDCHNTDDMKMEEDESPPFEPLEEQSNLIIQEENSVDSHLSGFSGMASHESNYSSDTKGLQIDLSNQDSQMSRNSSESRLSIVTSDDNTKLEANEDSQSKSLKPSDTVKAETATTATDENKKSDQINSKPKTEEKKSRSSDKSSDKSKSRSDRDRRDDKDRRSSSSKHSSSRDKDRDRKDSKSSSSRSDKDRHRSKHSSSSNRDKSGSRKDSKDRDKSRSSSSSHKDSKSKSSHSDSKSKSSSSSSHKKTTSTSHNSRHSSSSSNNSNSKRDKKDPKKEKDDHYSSKDKKSDRRSTDRDSNDGQPSKQSSTGTNVSISKTHKPANESNESSNTGQSGDSGNSDSIQGKAPIEVEVNDSELAISSQKVKLNKPKFASNMREAMKLMKIRKQLALLEKQNHLSLLNINSETEKQANGEEKINVEKSPTVLTKENWDALEARLYQEMSNISNTYGDTNDDRSDSEDFAMEETNSCEYLEKAPEKLEKKKEFLNEYVDKLQRDIDEKLNNSESTNKKRKTEEQADAKNNNKMNDSEDAGNLKKRVKRKSTTTLSDVPNESFPLPLSPAESDASSDKKDEPLDSLGKTKKTVNRGNLWANQRYSSDDLYKPRSTFASSRRRGAKNAEN